VKRSLLDILNDPNNGQNNFSRSGHEVLREGRVLKNLRMAELKATDDIKTGIVKNEDSGHIYPITGYILSMLSDGDLDAETFVALLEDAAGYCPEELLPFIRDNIERARTIKQTKISKWNTEEMEYYDRDVNTQQKRDEFLERIRAIPQWNIYIERKRHLVDRINNIDLHGKYVLEIGCGNARTISWIYPPAEHRFNYVGTDISLRRLMLAKQVIPEGDFVQCSAYNHPFRGESFDVAIAFGVLHHLPDPLNGISSCLSSIRQGGYFLVHEPLEKTKKFFRDGRLRKLEKFMEIYEHSEHDNDININTTLDYLGRQNVSIKHIHYSISAFRTITGRILHEFKHLRKSRAIWSTIIYLDQIFIKAFCRKPNILGPGAVFLVINKGMR
jgi:SAM-dependent methyltransferase